jgi:hypothetical protein
VDKTNLVESDFRDGEILIKELDQSHINVYAAFWLYDSDADRWRLMISSKDSDFASPKKAYIQINDVLESMKSRGITVNFSLENITVVSPIDPLITGLKKAVNTVPEDSSGFRFSRSRIGDSYIEDAYIYTI